MDEYDVPNAIRRFPGRDCREDGISSVKARSRPGCRHRELQKLGKFDTTTSSWLQTPPAIRRLCGASSAIAARKPSSCITTVRSPTMPRGASGARSGSSLPHKFSAVALSPIEFRSACRRPVRVFRTGSEGAELVGVADGVDGLDPAVADVEDQCGGGRPLT
jgi:hypothetical protein